MPKQRAFRAKIWIVIPSDHSLMTTYEMIIMMPDYAPPLFL